MASRTAAQLTAQVEGVTIARNNEAVVAASDTVFLCLLADVAAQVLPAQPFRAGQAVVSVMVDKPLARLRTLCAPATDLAITIALPPVSQGGCPLPVFPRSAALEALYGARNPLWAVRDERALNAHFGATALCSPLLEQMQTAATWLAGFSGDAAAAEAYVCALIRAHLPASTNAGALAPWLHALSTEGGLNATLRAAMAPGLERLRAGLDGFRSRLGLSEG